MTRWQEDTVMEKNGSRMTRLTRLHMRKRLFFAIAASVEEYYRLALLEKNDVPLNEVSVSWKLTLSGGETSPMTISFKNQQVLPSLKSHLRSRSLRSEVLRSGIVEK